MYYSAGINSRRYAHFTKPDMVTHKQLQMIYSMQRRLGIKPTWDKKMSRLMASNLIASLQDRLKGQPSLF